MEYFVETPSGVRIFVNDLNPAGTKTLLFIHGWPASQEMFEYQYSELVPKGYRCVGVDTRGFGRSDKPLDGYCYDQLADDIFCVIQALGLTNITLLGHSTGGAIAIRYMSRYQGHCVSKLVLCASAAPSLIQLPGFPYGQKREDIEKNIIQAADVDRPNMLKNFGDSFFYRTVSSSFSMWFLNLGLQAASWSTVKVANIWLTEQLFVDLPSIQVPTLIMHGVHDQVVPYPLGITQHQGIPQSRFIPFEASGHGLFYDERSKFNRELIQFIES